MRPAAVTGLLALAIALGFAAGRAFPPRGAGDRSEVGGAAAGDASHEAAPAPAEAEPPREAPCVPPARPTLAPAPRKGREAIRPFPPGTAILRIGDGYVFGEDHAPSGAAEGEVDVLCEDIRGGATLACPHGAIAADLPLGAVGLPDTAGGAAGLLPDAPKDLPERHANLVLRPSPQASGIALVRARTGTTFKVWLKEERSDVNALLRLVEIGYEEVPAVEGGGVLRVAVTRPLGAEGGATLADVKRLVAVGSSIPGDSFARFLEGGFDRFAPPDGETVLDRGNHVVLDGPLRSTLVVRGGHGAVFAPAGIDREGVVRNESYEGIAVKGDMAGRVDVRSYAYVHVTGDLVGEVDAGSYATVVIDGDLRGTLKVRSYVTLLLRGRLLGKIDPAGSCWSTFWLAGTRYRADLEAMEGNFRQVTLHVESSDAPPGKVDPPPGSWREVIVGDPAWAKIRR